jgi:hypothetical protein
VDDVGGAFKLSLLVALGWYVVVITAAFVGRAGVPAAPREACWQVFACMSPSVSLAVLVAIFGLPVGAGVVAITLVTAAHMVRNLYSPIFTGTISALCSVLGAAAIALIVTAGLGAL